MGDLSSRRGQVQGMDAADDDTVIKAQVPMSELLTYGAQLRSITQGRGSFHLEFSHYAEVPHSLQEKIIAQSKTGKEAARKPSRRPPGRSVPAFPGKIGTFDLTPGRFWAILRHPRHRRTVSIPPVRHGATFTRSPTSRTAHWRLNRHAAS